MAVGEKEEDCLLNEWTELTGGAWSSDRQTFAQKDEESFKENKRKLKEQEIKSEIHEES